MRPTRSCISTAIWKKDLKLDYWWMDAGWYIQQQGWPQVGTWEVDPKRFPRGLRPISDHAHAKGVKTLVWFEPERVMPGTWLYEHHPEWLLEQYTGRPASAGRHAILVVDRPARARSVRVAQLDSRHALDGEHPLGARPAVLPSRPKGEYSVVRFTAPEAGESMRCKPQFLAIDQNTTTDVHMLHHAKSVVRRSDQPGRSRQANRVH